MGQLTNRLNDIGCGHRMSAPAPCPNVPICVHVSRSTQSIHSTESYLSSRRSESTSTLAGVPATPIDPFGDEYTYLQVANDVARRIEAGEVTEKLPSERSLAEEYGVAYTTVRHAMEVLRERGMIQTVHGRGTFVARNRS